MKFGKPSSPYTGGVPYTQIAKMNQNAYREERKIDTEFAQPMVVAPSAAIENIPCDKNTDKDRILNVIGTIATAIQCISSSLSASPNANNSITFENKTPSMDIKVDITFHKD